MKNIRFFYLKIFVFLVVNVSVYLNRHVFVMCFQPKSTDIFRISPWKYIVVDTCNY